MKFKIEKKEELLQGRSIKYLSLELECTYVHICNILNGKSSCSKYLARDIVSKMQPNAKVEDYFDTGE